MSLPLSHGKITVIDVLVEANVLFVLSCLVLARILWSS